MPHMYILEGADGTYYTGSTPDLERRLINMKRERARITTAKLLPVRLAYSEYFPLIEMAFHREKQVQGWTHAKKKR